MHAYVHLHVCNVCIYAYMDARACVHVQVCRLLVCVCVGTSVCVRVCVHVYMCVLVCTYAGMHVLTHEPMASPNPRP